MFQSRYRYTIQHLRNENIHVCDSVTVRPKDQTTGASLEAASAAAKSQVYGPQLLQYSVRPLTPTSRLPRKTPGSARSHPEDSVHSRLSEGETTGIYIHVKM